ncbi:putative quinol monooxygenase [Algoriphagus resistens]|uniref:putative quinol monooxygenase n=1 Tax=Algoriphagus resistens TaxID=1750590 RepID=UPI000B2390B3|nr:putative quinol monooxygenase [Algoriphagus resistens]
MKQLKQDYTKLIFKGAFILVFSLSIMIISQEKTFAQAQSQVIRMAKLKIDPTQLESYKTFLKEEIETSIRLEPGVIALNAVSDRSDPTKITILEVYASQAAYLSHLETPHFLTYKNETAAMVESLELAEVDAIILGSKKE